MHQLLLITNHLSQSRCLPTSPTASTDTFSRIKGEQTGWKPQKPFRKQLTALENYLGELTRPILVNNAITDSHLQQQQQRPDLSRLMQLQAAGGVPGGLPGLPPGFPGSALPGMHPGLGGIPTSAASLLAGLPPSSSAASALMAAHMGVRMPAPPGLPNPQDLLKKEEEERERANSSKPRTATPGPLSDERNVSSS